MYHFSFRTARSCTTTVVFRITATDRNLAYFHATVDSLVRGVQSMVLSLARDDELRILFEAVEGQLIVPDDLPDIEILEMVSAAGNRRTTHAPSL